MTAAEPVAPKLARRLAAMFCVAVLWGCASQPATTAAEAPAATDCTPGQRLEVGQVCRLSVAAAQSEVALPLALHAGDSYRIELPAGQRWADWQRPPVDPLAGDEGGRLMKWFAGCKRLPEAPYMVVGLSLSACASQPAADPPCARRLARLGPAGYLLEVGQPTTVAFFANDVALLNWNNSGAVWVTVQRLPDGASRPISSRT